MAPERAGMPAIAFSDLSTPEGRQTLADAVVTYGGIKPACRALKLDSGNVFARMRKDTELATEVRDARAALDEQLHERIQELEELLMADDHSNESISAIREVLHSLRWRIGRTSKVYGDKPANVTNIQNNVGITCDAKTRAALIALREQIKAPAPVTALEEGRGYTIEIADAELAYETQD
jgi:hypothetical protein